MVPAVAEFLSTFEVARPIAEVFEWHRDTRNAPGISPPWQRLVAVDGSFPLDEGDEVVLTVRPPGAPFGRRLRIRIAVVRAPVLIVDEMLNGPFRSWRHEHCFRDLGEGRTRVTDHVVYRLPLGAERVLEPAVRRAMASMFAYRAERSRALLEARDVPDR